MNTIHDGDQYGGRFLITTATGEAEKRLQRIVHLIDAADEVSRVARAYSQGRLDADRLARSIAHLIAARRVMYAAGDLSAAVISAYADKICGELAAALPDQPVPVRSPEESHDH